MPFGDLAHDGQTGPGSFDVASHRSPEQLKNALVLIGWYPGASVPYDESGRLRPFRIDLDMGAISMSGASPGATNFNAFATRL